MKHYERESLAFLCKKEVEGGLPVCYSILYEDRDNCARKCEDYEPRSKQKNQTK